MKHNETSYEKCDHCLFKLNLTIRFMKESTLFQNEKQKYKVHLRIIYVEIFSSIDNPYSHLHVCNTYTCVCVYVCVYIFFRSVLKCHTFIGLTWHVTA